MPLRSFSSDDRKSQVDAFIEKIMDAFRHYQILALSRNKFTLAFRDSRIEAAFLDYYFDAYLHHGRVCHVLSIFFYAVFGLVDYFAFHESFTALAIIRYAAVIPVFASGLILSFTVLDFYKKHWQLFFSSYVLIAGVGIIGITVLSKPPIGYYQFIGVIICLIFGYTFVRLRFFYASISGTLLCLVYAYAGTWIMEIPSPLLMIQLAHLFGINFLGMLVCYSLELSARSDFYLNRLLEKEKALLDNVNMKLEQKILERTWELESSNQQLKAKIAELEKAEQARKKLEAQFLQAQKMEAVGRLAGGVAHDYNNMLTVILGYAEIIRFLLKPDDPVLDSLLEIEKAAKRSRDITRQLLAFSRQQIVATEILDMNRLILNSEKALKRLIGEDIELRFSSTDNLWTVDVDPSQIDQILFNLVINARDAMPGGGKLFLETANMTFDKTFCEENSGYETGDFVELTVSDSGCGMDQNTMNRIFEPFFTTKGPDKGTGLGLSTVYGIVKQNNGFLIVESEPGSGTTFKIYIPHSTDQQPREKERDEDLLTKGNGKILLVEDDKMVRRMVKAMLEKLGYNVLVAETAQQALELCRDNSTVIDLLLTDVVMPEMDGKVLSEKIQALRPELKALFMSGYTSSAIAHRGVMEDHIHFIQKPFTQKELGEKVHKIKASG